MRGSEAGFSLIEILIAAALFAAAAFGAFEALRQLAANGRQLTARHLASAALERLTAQLRAEARSATAIWSSSPQAGAAHDGCVQLDFFTADAGGPRFWSYRSFPNHLAGEPIPGDVLQRLAGTAPIPPCDPGRAAESALSALQRPFALAAIAPDRLAAHRDAYLDLPDSPFVGGAVPAASPVSLGVLDAAGAAVQGGNTLIELQLATAAGSRVVELLPGVLPGGFTELLRYTCSERCDVGHDTAGPKTLTTCATSWTPGWSTFARWSDYRANPDGSLTFPGGWFIGGTFAFTYSGTRASDGGADALVKPFAATNWDAARDYAAFPPDRAAADGSSAGSFAPWDVRAESADAWLADFAPYLAAAARGPIAAERARCDAVRSQGANGGFYPNG